MWSRNGIEASNCPKTSITVKSEMLLEEFCMWNATGRIVTDSLFTVVWQAFGVLEREERRMKEHAW